MDEERSDEIPGEQSVAPRVIAGPRIYNLFPLLAGTIEGAPGHDWHSHLARVADMNFNWLFVNPFHAPGFSGSLYAIKDPYALHPMVRGASEKQPDNLLGGFIEAASDCGLDFMMDLVINHTSKDAHLVDDHPEWYRRDDDGNLSSPAAIDPADARKVTVWGDLAQLDYDDPAARAGLIAYWSAYLRHHIGLGVRGFRCDAAYQVPAEVWSELIAVARNEADGILFAAETLGSPLEQVQALERAGFDYLFNSAKWWDFRAPWLLEQYGQFRRVAPSIAFPESHDTERLAVELGIDDLGELIRHYRQRYLFAASFSAGVMMPMGFEYGFSRALDVVRTTQADWEAARFDLCGFIAEVNAMKAECPALNLEGPQRRVPAEDDEAIVLLRLAGEAGEGGCAVVAINPSSENELGVDAARLLIDIGGTYDHFTDMTPEAEHVDLADLRTLTLEPLQIRVFRGHYALARNYHRDYLSAVPGKEVIDAILGADHEDPFATRGMQQGAAGGDVVVRTFQPGASGVEVIDAASGEAVAALSRVHADGFFAGAVKDRQERFAYRLRITDGGGAREVEDAYRFPMVLGDMDVYLLSEGTHRRAFEKLGAHPIMLEEVSGVAFAVWAPNARRVAVVGDFNNWDGRCHPMRLRHNCGVWEIFVPGLDEGERYKFEIKGAHGELLPLKADPYGFAAEHPPRTASIVRRTDRFEWRDAEWMATRAERSTRDAPLVIYEAHLGSWRRATQDGDRYLTYRELSEQLIPYVKDMGFTHIQLMPISEYPFDGSWGYQPIGLFAPTSRYGSPEEFKEFVDACHQAELGLLIDWVPGHFPTDPHGLGQFDGTHLYEHADPRQGFHQDWNTLIYNYGRTEVANFVLSNALFWLERYHIDGLRVDAVASMLYLDYSREQGQWIPNRYGGNENLEAIDLIRRVNELAYGEHAGAFTVAEESTAWPGVSKPTYLGGLGFGFKWNMGWMHDTLDYMGHDPIHRGYHHHQMTFGLLYAFSENFVLPLSHDEVVHGKGSLLARMPGDAWQQFANLRAYYGFMWTHPGKKLLFMGGEFAQGREWNHDTGLDWSLLDVHWHAGVQALVRDLNHLYRGTPALHQFDCEADGFDWIKANDSEESVYAYLRRGKEGTAPVVVVCNFTPVVREGFRVGVPEPGFYAERLNTDAAVYGGSNVGNPGGVAATPVPWDGRSDSISISLPPLAALVFELANN